ncbi:MAG TPA: XkdF-like putative serine protease domain-containing protein [Bacteroidia bacterium]|nr:XkdF-like putative serine protease domain-containing protein [Bacteroidia bacterium]
MDTKQLPVYKLVITDEDPVSGVDYVALVDVPATEFNWVAFSKQHPLQFKIQHEEQRIIGGALMVANLPIYRKENGREYYVVFDEPTIKTVCYKYFRNRFTSNVNLMHNPQQKVGGVYMVQSYLIDKQNGINAPDWYTEIPDGSWFGCFKVDNKEVWDNYIKTGRLQGFSVEGMFGQMHVTDASEVIIQQLIEIIKNEND